MPETCSPNPGPPPGAGWPCAVVEAEFDAPDWAMPPLAWTPLPFVVPVCALTAAAKQRPGLSILLGIPSQEVLNAYMPYKDSADALVELEAGTALSLPRCRVWAPTWTRAITPADVDAMHAQNRKVITWTVDLRESIVNYLGRVDGILSNYPSLVSAIHDCSD